MLENHKSLEPAQLKALLQLCFENDGEFPLTVTGSSMTPFLGSGRDRVYLHRPAGALRRGDIAFYERAGGQLILHRVCRVDGQGRYYFVGDAQQEIEGPIRPEQILAVAARAERKGRIQQPGSFWWEFFRTVWLWLLPARRRVMTAYARLRGRVQPL